MLTASRKIDYALLVMASLPEARTREFRSLQEMAHEKKLSAGFLSQVMTHLKKAGLVISREGISGGYQLARPSSQIRIAQIYEALEGPLRLTTCLDQRKKCVCEKRCPTKTMWSELQGMMNQYLQKKTLSEFRVQSSEFRVKSSEIRVIEIINPEP